MYQTAHTGETRVTTPYHYLHSCNMAESSLHQWLCKRQGTITPRTLMYRNRNLLAKKEKKKPHTHFSQSSLLSDTRSLSVVSGRAIPNEGRFEALTSKNSPGYGSGFPDLLYLKPPEHKDSKKDVKGGRSAYRLPTYLAIGQSSRLDRWFHKCKISVTLDLWGLSAATPVPRAREKSLLCMFILTLMLLFCFPHCALLLFPWQWYRSRCA